MKLLVVKTSSFGDIVHAFPALTDAWRLVDGLICDWLVEDAFASMPAWHPAVRKVIPVSMRGWRRAPWLHHAPAIRRFIQRLRHEHYDLVLDAQGLLKSAVLSRCARGRRTGFATQNAREPLAARLYDDTVEVGPDRHAVDRNRLLFAGALNYALPEDMAYGLRLPAVHNDDEPAACPDPYLVFIPGTTWPSKRWPMPYWRALTQLAANAGWRVRIVSGSLDERDTAGRISMGIENADPAPWLSIDNLAHMLRGARAVVSVDSGPGHLAAAVGTPGVSIYGATDPALTGTRGSGQLHLRADFECAPCRRRRCRFADTGRIHPDCYASVPPVQVWRTLHGLIQEH
ncbi:MAG: Lipopolysaccharide heptosyltransferase 1 [Gammaproteobacteria bacterium]|nr:Lipopolysaccharide heptosyltransferase 1 [Gammaproteobacteria bacterium]